MDNLTQQILFQSSIEDDKLSQLKQLYPNCFTKNGEFIADKFNQIIQEANIPISQESYSLQWLGKSYAKTLEKLPPETLLAEDTPHNTKPENTESQNLLIKGDNLEVLKHLRKAYSKQVKMIYIDPPYNTGSDGFVYHDNRKFTAEQLAELGNMDLEAAQRVLDFTSKKSSSHSAWLTFMYPRLYIAHELLHEDGVIFISIDDNEVAQLKILCDDVFGEGNFVGQIIVDGTPKNDPHIVSTSHEYCIIYAKNKINADKSNYGISNPLYKKIIDIYDSNKNDYKKVMINLDLFYKENKLQGDNISNYKYADDFGVFRIGPLDDPQNSGPKDMRINPKTGRYCKVPSRGWSCTIDKWDEWVANNLIDFPDSDEKLPSKKTYISDERLDVLRSYIKMQTRKGTNHLKNLFKTEITPFANPKPTDLLKDFILNTNDKNAIYLDFFAGSGSFGEAVWLTNQLDKGQRKFILVQIDERIKIQGSGKARKIAKAAYDFVIKKMEESEPTIFHLTKARLEKSAVKIRQEFPNYQGDLGFKIFETMDDFRAPILDSEQGEMYPIQQFSAKQIQTLLTTWRVFDGQPLTDKAQTVALGDYIAYLCDETLYLLGESLNSAHIKTLIELLDDTVNHRDFVPKRIVLHGDLIESSKQKELAQAVQTYANKKNIHISLIARV